jgi:predicted nucleic acid-binding protein
MQQAVGGEWLESWAEQARACIAGVTKIEALGFASIKPDKEQDIGELLSICVVHAPGRVGGQPRGAGASRLEDRHARRDIEARALEHDVILVTRNVDDFKVVEGLRVINPFEESGAPR